ncbi:hypothetical protein ACFDTO_36345 [Microbacteriaceae bacterium 4G12]
MLQLIVGSEEKGEVISLGRLCTSPDFLDQCIYEVQELKPLRLRVQYEEEMNITFIWNKVYEGKKNDMEWKYQFQPNRKSALLYEHGKTDRLYPWRCGFYHFEVQVGNKYYYGAFHITPKNFDDEQLVLIQNTIKSILSTLIMDRGYYKKTFAGFRDVEDHSYMQTIRWLSNQIKKIKHLYLMIEKQTSYEAVYKREHRFRKPTCKTIQKNERNMKLFVEKQYNRSFFESRDCIANQWMKHKTKSFWLLVYELLQFLQENIEKLERMEAFSKQEKQAVQTIMKTIEKNGSVTERDKQKFRNIHLLKDTDLKKIVVKIREYKVLHGIIKDLFVYLSNLLHSSFWSDVSDLRTVPKAPLPPPNRQLLQLFEISHHKKTLHSHDPSFLFVYKPTFLIYEYYVYFAFIQILEDMGFHAQIPLRQQIEASFYLDGLQDGTTVVLEKEDIHLRIVFNELIETHPLVALSKGSNFYNGEDTKKPDIRIDYYKKEQEQYCYQSSVIVEVKYSPMYNIFQPVGNTKATEQMYKYWSIKYVYEQDGKHFFHRRAIHEVICVYPGSQIHAKKIEAGCGIFLQFYPYKTKQGEEKLAGRGDVIKLFRTWLQLEEEEM